MIRHEQTSGMFGPVSIVQSDDSLNLLIGQQVQGGAYLSPHAVVRGQPVMPGPVSSSKYSAGWLLAGTQNENGSAFMVGLGSGSGACALLHNFPNMDLTIVELDPAIIAAAQKWFPLLQQYQDEGRLNIITADATACLTDALGDDNRWDIGFLDAYTGSNTMHAPPELIGLLLDRCDNVWINCIDHERGPQLAGLMDLMANNGRPACWVFRCSNEPGMVGNLVLTTQDVDPQTADAFVPYADLEGPSVDEARMAYTDMLRSGHQAA